MISVYLECAPHEREALVAELWERGTLGILELASGVRAWFETAGGLADLIDRYDGDLITEAGDDWVERAERSFPPVAIGNRLWLAPPWNKEPPPEGRIRLEMNPGMACGTGWHPCTQMCLEALERYMGPGAAVLDVGAGSGILTAAARLLGAARAVACDIDEPAVRIARDRIGDSIFVGSVDAARSGAFDVVVANISDRTIRALLPELHRAAGENGRLILSGFHALETGDPPVETITRDGWMCVVL